ncbi:OLC1v1034938C1 [Oldenlandia corymbosa var. corymbosa]|uniref:OLC1v1034938C1 n=1 Tax=Oldenlandia corymbosa var. corymbosa TaxID=529605 RepID=A0AAV1CSJ6_OLDCO|nr:OLC1v1034938C1 [Oldenlandia corymbosa var. corymbosa]
MGCSTGIGVSHFLYLQKKSVFRIPSLDVIRRPNAQGLFSSSSIIKSGPCLYYHHSEKRRLPTVVLVSLSNPGGPEPESAATLTTIPEQTSNTIQEGDFSVVKSKENNGATRENGNGGYGISVDGSGGGGNGKFSGGGGGGGGSDDDGNDYEEEEFGPLLKFDEVMRETEARGANLPADMLEAAKNFGLRKLLLLRYLDLQSSAGLLGFFMRTFPMLRNRMLADPSFLFKIGTEIVIDSCCATFAEVQKRGKDFWAEFELYAADLLVGVVVNVALVGMLAPYARIGQSSASQGVFGRMLRAYGALPSSVFEAQRPGCQFSINQRVATYFFKGILYGLVGFGCGIVGQGIANMIMTAKRNIKKSEEDVPVPPLLKSAALWGVFLAVSSNTRYQIINGLERLVEASPMAKQFPPVAMAFTVGVRFGNNVYGGMQFVDWARWSGVQ